MKPRRDKPEKQYKLNKPILGITMGDPAGIGPEVIAKALAGTTLRRICSPLVSVGDLAVVCAAGAPHRAEAFKACRALIDRIKHRVPIWKREHGPDGPYWVGWEDARCLGHDHHR